MDQLIGTRSFENQIKLGLQPFQTEATVHQLKDCAHFAAIHIRRRKFSLILFHFACKNQIKSGLQHFQNGGRGSQIEFTSSPLVVEIELLCCPLFSHRVYFPLIEIVSENHRSFCQEVVCTIFFKAWLATYFELPHPQLCNPKSLCTRNRAQLAFLMIATRKRNRNFIKF